MRRVGTATSPSARKGHRAAGVTPPGVRCASLAAQQGAACSGADLLLLLPLPVPQLASPLPICGTWPLPWSAAPGGSRSARHAASAGPAGHGEAGHGRAPPGWQGQRGMPTQDRARAHGAGLGKARQAAAPTCISMAWNWCCAASTRAAARACRGARPGAGGSTAALGHIRVGPCASAVDELPPTHLDEVGGRLVPERGQQLLLRHLQPQQQLLLGAACSAERQAAAIVSATFRDACHQRGQPQPWTPPQISTPRISRRQRPPPPLTQLVHLHAQLHRQRGLGVPLRPRLVALSHQPLASAAAGGGSRGRDQHERPHDALAERRAAAGAQTSSSRQGSQRRRPPPAAQRRHAALAVNGGNLHGGGARAGGRRLRRAAQGRQGAGGKGEAGQRW